jgi:hypothetical protein
MAFPMSDTPGFVKTGSFKVSKNSSSAVLPGGHRHGHFPQMWQFKKIIGRGKFVVVSGRKVAVKGSKKVQKWP